MTLKDALKRIDELECRVKELEARPQESLQEKWMRLNPPAQHVYIHHVGQNQLFSQYGIPCGIGIGSSAS